MPAPYPVSVAFKVCSKCGVQKDAKAFSKKSKSTDGLCSECKTCASIVRREYEKNNPGRSNEWYWNNPEKARARNREWHKKDPERAKKNSLKTKYNTPLEDYQRVLVDQQNKCAICREEFGSGKWEVPCVDHDHACCPGSRSCGKCVRGLLCRACNRMLGNANDRPDILERAVAYLMSYHPQTELTEGNTWQTRLITTPHSL